ncbi:hypothetical protein K488DRAFT_81394 [Vararia minispora EC-137]|uniref:Uncharacterized protein n=1 Tax=Vararia minispora EC-137 TaxID=1314806 RepID=A0ACB8R058_9AGAM|nr:hypothetical protein K488DRAFT_81394 [Vararia minispora EC-137]
MATAHSNLRRAGPGAAFTVRLEGKRLPWQVAEEMIPRLKKQNISKSSAFVIYEAYKDFQSGIKYLNDVSTQAPPDMPMAKTIFGWPGVLDLISNAILQDPRCFHISDGRFQQQMNMQIQMELTRTRSPQNLQDFDSFVADIRLLHAEGGYNLSRLAFSTPVRVLLCRAYMESNISTDWVKGVGLYDHILKLLRWGREEWKDVPDEQRGPVLKGTFVNGVRMLRLDAYMQGHAKDNKSPTFTLDGLLQEADSLLEDVRANPPRTCMPGFNLAFGDYIAANALAMKGYYWNHKTREVRYETKDDLDRGIEQFKMSASFYSEAASMLPEDEEKHAMYKKCALDQLFVAGAPLFVTLPLLEGLWPSVIVSQEIWQFGQASTGTNGKLYDYLEEFHTDMKTALKNDAVNMWCSAAPAASDPNSVFGDAMKFVTTGPSKYM